MKKKSVTLLVAGNARQQCIILIMYWIIWVVHKLLDWNRNIDSKFVNELVFIASGLFRFTKSLH